MEETISTSSNNPATDEVGKETLQKLKGDSIGTTLFSESFLLRTLLEFEDLKWSKEFEDNICFLWDSTVEEEVCDYLFDIEFPALVCDAIQKHSDLDRFIEIVIGILANILTFKCKNRAISEAEIESVVWYLNSEDPLILIQVVRFLTAVVHFVEKSDYIYKYIDQILEKLTFFLESSTNADLLQKTLQLIAKLTDPDCHLLNNSCISPNLFDSALVAYRSLQGEVDAFEFEAVQVRYVIEILNNICSHADAHDIQKSRDIFLDKICCEVLNYLADEANLFPITELYEFFFSAFLFIFKTLQVKYRPKLLAAICRVIFLLRDCSDSDYYQTCIEMFCYLIHHNINISKICKEVNKLLPEGHFKVVLQLARDSAFKFDFEYMDRVSLVMQKVK